MNTFCEIKLSVASGRAGTEKSGEGEEGKRNGGPEAKERMGGGGERIRKRRERGTKNPQLSYVHRRRKQHIERA